MNDWKTVHREQCEKLQRVFVPPPAGWREAQEAVNKAAGGDGGGGGGAADEENFKRLSKLVHDRSPGRHTHVVRHNLGCCSKRGQGVKQDCKAAVEWYRKAAEQGGYRGAGQP